MNLFIKGLIYSLSYLMFYLFTPPLYQVIDPCANTPGYDFGNTIWIILSYSILFSLLAYWYVAKYSRYKFLVIIVLVFFLPFVLVLFNYAIFAYIISSDFWQSFFFIQYLFEYDFCYGDRVVNEKALIIFSSLSLLLCSFLFAKFICRKSEGFQE